MHLCLAMTSAISKVPVVSTEKRKKEEKKERETERVCVCERERDKEKEGSVRRWGKRILRLLK